MTVSPDDEASAPSMSPNKVSAPVHANQVKDNLTDEPSSVNEGDGCNGGALEKEEEESNGGGGGSVEIVEESGNDDKDAGIRSEAKASQATLTETTAPMLAKLSSWGKQANANAKDFWSKHRVTGTVFSDTIKKSLPLTTATLETPSPTSRVSKSGKSYAATTDEERKEAAEAKEAETLLPSLRSGSDLHKINAAEESVSKERSPLMPQANAVSSPSGTATTASQSNANALLKTPVPLRTVETAPPSGLSTGSVLSPQSARSGVSDDANCSFVSYDDDTVSSYISSTYTSDDGTVRSTLKWAAASVVDSMQTYRGRYNRSASETLSDSGTPSTPSLHVRMNSLPSDLQTQATSQTHRILQSRAKQHLQDLMEGLEHNQYLMLLGHGMLGVNLKPTYLKHGGVFVDYLVEGGAAQKSGIIRPGDALCRIGELDVRKGNILQVPNQIAQARRPIHLVFSTGVVTEDRINYIDIATALLHTLVQTTDRASVVRFEEPSIEDDDDAPKDSETENITNSTAEEDDGSAAMELVKPTSFENDENANETTIEKASKMVPDIVHSSKGFLRPTTPPPELRQAFLETAAQRCNESFFRADRLWLSGGVSSDANLVLALKHAFTLTTADGRRLAFLVRHWSKEEDSSLSHSSALDNNRKKQQDENQFTNSPNAMLMLYLELFQYVELYDVTPTDRRRGMAQKVANKFFLPVVIGTELVPPMLDFHHLVPTTSLRLLESTLKDESTPVPIDVFQDFQQAVIESLTGQYFLSFLVSDECSRMRAYMRNTAPFFNVPLKDVIDQVVEDRNSHSKNYLLYIVVYLLSQIDPEEVGETSEILDHKKVQGVRVDEAAASLCGAIFIKRTLLTAIHTINEKKNKQTMMQLFDSLEKFWEFFLSPSVGSLDATSLSAETRAKLKC